MVSVFVTPGNPLHRMKRYSEFYNRIIQDNFPADQVFISNVQKILDSGEVRSAPQVVDNLGYHQCAYMLQFGAFDSSLTERKFYGSASKYEKMIRNFSCKNHISICCLENQGIFAAVGLCKVIEESIKQLGFLSDDSTRVQIVIIDKNVSWKPLAKSIVAAAKKEFPRLQLKLIYIEGDLSRNFSKNVKLALEKSLIVTSVNHLSVLPSAQINLKSIKKTLASMKKNAILFFLYHDSEEHHIRSLKDFISRDSSFSEILSSRKPEKRDVHKETTFCHAYQSISPSDFLGYEDNYSTIFSIWIKNPKVKTVLQKQVLKFKTVAENETSNIGFYVAKKSSNKIRNSETKFRLDGKFACIDMEKRNKDDSKRHIAKDVAASRYINFDDWDEYH